MCDGCGEVLADVQIALTAESNTDTILPHSNGETLFHWCSTCASALLRFMRQRRRNESES